MSDAGEQPEPRGPDDQLPYLPPVVEPESAASSSQRFPNWGAAVDRVLGVVERRRALIVVLGALFQLLVLVWIAAPYALALADTGSKSVLLRVVPVDPRDPIRGDYVTLALEVARVDRAVVAPGGRGRPGSPSGEPVYVFLEPEPDGRHYHGAGAATEPPAPGSRLFLRGTVDNWGRATFGLESFFVQEGKGLVYEKAARRRQLSAEVTISPAGQGVLRRLIVED